ncbi:hypothetical protein AcW1_000444 [Taiwanofungus camphoratus]|nr:hypothetical protein AcW1_000444 [Antrodia cinnamomea]
MIQQCQRPHYQTTLSCTTSPPLSSTRSDETFLHAQLLKVNRGTAPLQTLPQHILPPHWGPTIPDQRRVAYVLQSNSSAPLLTPSRPPPQGVKTPDGRALTRRELEDVFYHCKTLTAATS